MKNAEELLESILEDAREAERKANDPVKTYYAFADPARLTWFISQGKHCPIRGAKLLLVLRGEPTDLPIATGDSYPVAGDIVADKNGQHVRVIEVRDY